MDIEHINEHFKNSIEDTDYKRYFDYLKLNLGQANQVFEQNVINKIQLKYSNWSSNNKFYNRYTLGSDGDLVPSTNATELNIQGLISNNTMHQSQARAIKNLCFNDEVEVKSNNEDIQEEINKIDNILDKLKQGIETTNYSGSCLYRAIYDLDTKEISTDLITNQNYFPIFSKNNKTIKVAYVEYNCIDEEHKIYRVIIHSKGYNKLFFANMSNYNEIKPIDDKEALERFSKFVDVEIKMDSESFKLKDGRIEFDNDLQTLVHIREFKDKTKFDVAEAFTSVIPNKVYPVSNYSNGSYEHVRDWIVTDSTEKQVLTTMLKPKILLSSAFAERDLKTGESKINIQNEVVIANEAYERSGVKPFYEQIPIDLKTDEITTILERADKGAMKCLGLTKALLGESETGGLSGTAKELDLINILSTCEDIRKNNSVAYEYVINFGAYEVHGIDLGLEITWGELIPSGELDRANIAVIKLNNRLDTPENILKKFLKKDDVLEVLQYRETKEAEEKAQLEQQNKNNLTKAN